MIYRKNRFRILACTLALLMALSNTNVIQVVAVSKENTSDSTNDKQKVEEKEARGKKKKSNSKTDVIVKYKNQRKKDNTTKNIQGKTKVDSFKHKNHFEKQGIDIYEIGEGDNMNTVINLLNEDPNVEYAHPNYLLTTVGIPTDNEYIKQWGIHNDGQAVDGYVGRTGVDIKAVDAWTTTMGSDTVVIGVLDTGIDINHPDLKGNIYINPKEIAGNNIDDDNNGYVDDVNGWDFVNDNASVNDSESADSHGTNIAGVIAAGANNNGMVGVAPNVKLLPLKFISGSQGYTSDAIEAIEYAMNMGIKIINCSFCGTDNNIALKDAMENSGILFVCSAGNFGANTAEKPVYPAAFELNNIISVAAIDSRGLLPSFTSYGYNVDLAAPGTSILCTTYGEANNVTYNDNYDYYSGTSVSAAMVSGVAGLVKSAYPEDDIYSIRSRIINNVVKCEALKGKVYTEGRVNAYGALNGGTQSTDDFIDISDFKDFLPVDGTGKEDTWYITDERASNYERLHYGEGGVNPASGNFSVTCTDMSVAAPGFQIQISRSYNSRDQKQTLLGRGWTFGFESSVIYKGDSVDIRLPNGSSYVFNYDTTNKKYVGEGTRAIFETSVGTEKYDILTTEDQYKYKFDSALRKLIYMEDRNGNRITITYDSNGKPTKITDTVNRVYTLGYNNKNLLASVTDITGRKVAYEYNTANLLTKVTDPEGGVLRYEYDSAEYLTKMYDQKDYLFQEIFYDHNLGDAQNKVSKTIDGAGETWFYTYDKANRNTTITNNNNKKWTYWFDAAMYTIKVQDPEGGITETEYRSYYNAAIKEITYYGDVKTQIDRNGNRTEYVVDEATGNVTQVRNPDGGIKYYYYDKYNNVIQEINEVGNKTFYIYDKEGKLLLKKVQPLEGVTDYVEGTSSPANYAITNYSYYSKAENNNIAGLLKTVTDPEGNPTTYTYNNKGDTVTIKDAWDNVTSFTYDDIGNKISQTTPEGYVYQWNYNKNAMIIREIYPDGGVKRTVYDTRGRTTMEVNQNQYDATKDNLSTDAYKGTQGTSYLWNDNGYLRQKITADNSTTTYTYDVFGNMQTETNPAGAIYRYEYDSLNRLIKTYYQETAASSKVLLYETSYSILYNGNTQIIESSYVDDNTKSIKVTEKDYAGREVKVQNPDGTIIQVIYNKDGTVLQKIAANKASTFYSYDPLGNVTGTWTPIMESNMQLFSWTGISYDKNGNIISQKTGRDLVTLNSTTANTYDKYYSYTKGLLIETYDNEGRRMLYDYDKDGRIIKQTEYINATDTQVTDTTYNHMGKELTVIKYAKAGDIYGNSYDDTKIINLQDSYTYDKNGNMTCKTEKEGHITRYTYDYMDRQLTEFKEGFGDGSGSILTILTSQTYTWDGQIATYTDGRGYVTTNTYDNRGNLITIKDALGNTTSKNYDRMGRVTSIISPNSNISGGNERTVFSYDDMGRVLKQTEVYDKMVIENNTWKAVPVSIATHTYQYDELGNIIKDMDALGNSKISDYNLAGLLEYETDAQTQAKGLPFTVKYTYNGLGQKVKETHNGASYSYTYDGVGNLLSTSVDGIIKSSTIYYNLGQAIQITDGNGNITSQKWNAMGKVAEVTAPGDFSIPGIHTVYQYDLWGNVKLSKDSNGTLTTYIYDSIGRNTSKTISNETRSNKITTKIAYDRNNNITCHKDGNGGYTNYVYDGMNRVQALINAKGQITTYTYDANGNKLTEANYLANTKQYRYDGINRLIEEKDALGNVVQQLEYNDANTQLYSYDALQNKTTYLYDRNMRNIGTTDAEGNTTSSTYDTRGNLRTKTDGNGNTTTYHYDSTNRLIKVTDALGQSTSYTYDNNDNLISQTDGNGNVSTFQYNVANKMIARIDPEGRGNSGKTETYTYYSNGLMATKKNRNGVITNYTYDIFGRLLSEDAGGEVQSYTYDANGNMLTMTDATGTTTRTYDRLNRNISKAVPEIGLSTYEYDLTTSEEGVYQERTTDPKGNVTLKEYDQVGRLSKVTVDDKTTVYKYSMNGRRTSVTYPDGTKETYTYDKVNNVLTLKNTKKDSSLISSYEYTYDSNGNVLTKKEEKGITSYIYDELNRLSSVTEPGGKTTSYDYDGAGNRVKETVTLTQNDTIAQAYTNYTYNSQNRLMKTVSNSGSETRYLYDSNGNMVSKSTLSSKTKAGDSETTTELPSYNIVVNKGSGTGTEDITLFFYDKFNRQVRVKTAEAATTYRYNAQGYRSEKNTEGKIIRYLYEVDKVVLETDGSNNQTAYQAYGTNLLYRSVAEEAGAGAESYYYLYNAHGDVTGLIDAIGNIAATYDYDAFGTIISETGTANNTVKYAGYQYDKETDLYYLNARYYDSTIARFLTEDTYRGQRNDPLSLNLYTYCNSNPIRFFDPSGHMAEQMLDKYSSIYNKLKKSEFEKIIGIISSKTESSESGKEITNILDGSKLGSITSGIIGRSKSGIAGPEKIGTYNIDSEISYNYFIYHPGESVVISNLIIRSKNTDYIMGNKVNKLKNNYKIEAVTTKYGLEIDDFVAIHKDDITYFGGYQDWFAQKSMRNTGCGTVAAANILTYMAMSGPWFSDLYPYDLDHVTKIDFYNFMNDIAEYVTPAKWGVLPPVFINGVIDYASDKGIVLETHMITSNSSLAEVTDFIRVALTGNHPVAFLDYLNPITVNGINSETNKPYTDDNDLHWVTITGMTVNRNTGDITLEISTWGDRATVSLNELYDNINFINHSLNTLFPSTFIYFTGELI